MPSQSSTPDSSSNNFELITPANVNLAAETRYLYIGGTAGNVVVHNQRGVQVTFAVAANSYHPIRTKRIVSATATPVIAFYGSA